MTDLSTPIAPDPVNDPGNWREINRLQQLAASEGRTFDPDDPYNWKGIAAAQAATAAAVQPDPTITAPAATPGAAQDDRNVFAALAQYLADADLGSLFSLSADGTPSGWLWDQITSGIDNEAALQMAIEQTPQFQARYPAIANARQRSTSGAPVRVPTVRDVREYETTVATTLRQSGLPSWFYDNFNDIQSLMDKGLSAVEVEQRLGQTWEQVRNTNPAITQAFSDFYGVSGDAALAAFFLDPQRTQSALDKYGRTAYTSGMGRDMGIGIDKALAERIAGLPKTEAGIYQDLTEVSRMQGAGVFTEGYTETEDLNTNTGLGAVALGDGAASSSISRRILARQQNARSSAGGGALTQAGLTGVGEA